MWLMAASENNAGLFDLGVMQSGYSGSATGVSADGQTVVGVGLDSHFEQRAFRWRNGEAALTNLGTLADYNFSQATGVSADGRVIVGWLDNTDSNSKPRAFVLAENTGVMTDLGVLSGGSYSLANGVSASGRVIVGWADNSDHNNRAFRWTADRNQLIDLGTLAGGSYSQANAVSADGKVVVGVADRPDSRSVAFYWTESGNMLVELGTLGGNNSTANGVNADGSVIVGTSGNLEVGRRAFRWADGRMIDLGALPGYVYSEANGVSADGRVVVGESSDYDFHRRGFRWTKGAGMQTINEWLAESGVIVSSDLEAAKATGTNANGEVVVGQLTNGHAFIARSGKGLMTIEDVQESLRGNATSLNMGRSAGELVLNGAHGHPLQRRTAPGRFTAWAAGDLGSDDHGSRDGSLGVAEAGGGYNFGLAQANLAVGKTVGHQNTFLDGDTDFDGVYLITDLIVPIPGTPLIGTLTAFHQWGNLDSNRGYLNAGLSDYSAGSTDVGTTGGVARLDWADALTVQKFKITPYTKLSLSRTHVDGYTETGGGFPATYDARNDTISELAVGVNTARTLTKRLTLVNTLEGVHRFQGHGSTIDGAVAGVSAFSLPGETYRQDWLRGTVGVDCAVAHGVFSVSLNATTRGEASNLWLASSYQVHF